MGTTRNVGGWHDAGDYGRYMVNSGIDGPFTHFICDRLVATVWISRPKGWLVTNLDPTL
jgi:hypothetical protein